MPVIFNTPVPRSLFIADASGRIRTEWLNYLARDIPLVLGGIGTVSTLPEIREIAQSAAEVAASAADDAAAALAASVPAGGGTGQVLAKVSPSDNDVAWVDPGGGASWVTYTVDFGTTPVDAASFVVADAGVSATSTVELMVRANDSTAGNPEWSHDAASALFRLTAAPADGQFDLNVYVLGGEVTGEFKLRYRVGA